MQNQTTIWKHGDQFVKWNLGNSEYCKCSWKIEPKQINSDTFSQKVIDIGKVPLTFFQLNKTTNESKRNNEDIDISFSVFQYCFVPNNRREITEVFEKVYKIA